MLFLHIRFVDMDFCALILISSLPAIWIVVGCVLLLLLLIVTVLFFLKSREAAMLKKEVFELRDTMRMMRYEEANLARMLHTVSKPAEQAVSSVAASEESIEETLAPVAAEVGSTTDDPEAVKAEELETSAEELVEESAKAPAEVPSEEPIEEPAEQSAEEPAVIQVEELESSQVEVKAEELVAVAEETFEEASVEAQEEDLEPELETPVMPEPRKHAINERRPAIPTDLFSAWFAENEDIESEEVMEESSEVIETTTSEKDEAPVALQAETLEKTPEPVAQNKEPESVIEYVATASEDTAALNIEENEEPSGLSKEDERFRRKLERIVHTRLRNPNLNIDIIAAQLGLGRTNFYRKVRELMGMSPNDYLRKCRMERAAELLCNSELAVSDVCVQVGIPDAQYFSRVFKAHFGVSPSVYREQQSITQ